MGIWKNLRAGAAFIRDYQQDTMETVPRWARVVRVGRRVLGTVGVDVEIHYGQTPPHVESVSVSVPREEYERHLREMGPLRDGATNCAQTALRRNARPSGHPS